MKRFFLTVPGKVILFLVCLLSAIFTAGCIVAAVGLAEYGFYTHTEQTLFEDQIDGKLYNDMRDIANRYFWEDKAGEIERVYAADRTNLRFQLLDKAGNVICGNAGESGAAWSHQRWFEYFSDDDMAYAQDLPDEKTPALDNNADGAEQAVSEQGSSVYPVCLVRAYLEKDLPVADKYPLIEKAVHLAYSLRYAVYPLGILGFLLAIVSFVALMCAVARRPGSEDLHPGPLNGVPFDIMVLAAALLASYAFWLADGYFGGDYLRIALLFIWLLFAGGLGLGLCMAAASRVKQKNLLSNTLIWRVVSVLFRLLRAICRGLGAIFGNLSLVWRTVLILGAISLIELLGIGFSWHTGQIFAMWLVEKLIFIPLILYLAVGLRRLQQGGQALAAGDIDYQVDTSRLPGSFRRHGENLNSIGDGMSRAVAQRLKSERLKTELITNVSHDIKTPLTSIINYADLIGKEESDNEKIAEYSAVLLRQSERLKRLIDDLVEASKAQTGNLEVTLSPCDAGVFISQAEGEYEDKLKEAGLTLITSQPAKEVLILADGRRLWRVFDNLMNNAAKYSQSGTRVYLTLYEEEDRAVVTIRNTSREPLNISPDELMERFVRGDSARTTEGNGLGLSIAKSLTELQKGAFDIAIDGDLFKVTLSFPILRKTA